MEDKNSPILPGKQKVQAQMLRRDLQILVTFKDNTRRQELYGLRKLSDAERMVTSRNKYSKKLAEAFGFSLKEVETITMYRINKAGAVVSNPIFYPEDYNEKPKAN